MGFLGGSDGIRSLGWEDSLEEGILPGESPGQRNLASYLGVAKSQK